MTNSAPPSPLHSNRSATLGSTAGLPGAPDVVEWLAPPPCDRPWLKTLLIAAMYLAAALAGNLLSGPSSAVPPMSPAAGVGFAALLVYSLRCWPGVWLGAFVAGLGTDAVGGPAVSAATAAGPALQALVGAWLTLRFLREAGALSRDSDLMRLLVIAGPLACLVSATLGVGILFGFGRVPAEGLLDEWFARWAGDTVGVLLFAPLVLLAWPNARRVRLADGGAHRAALPLLVTAVLLAAGNEALVRIEENRERTDAEHRMEEIKDIGFATLPTVIASLRAVERFIVASAEVTRDDFDVFSRMLTDRPEVIAIDWAPRVPRSARADFEAAARREGFGDFGIFEFGDDNHRRPAADRAEYFPLLYSEPAAANGRMLGLDHAFDPARRAAMARAAATGRIVVADLVRPARTGRRAVLVYLPVPRAIDAPEALAGDDLRGYVVGVFDVERLLAPIADQSRERGFGYRVSDVTRGDPARVLQSSLPEGATPSWKDEVDFGGRTWRLEMQAAEPIADTVSQTEGRFYRSFSMLAAFLAVFAVLGSAGRGAATAAQVAERTSRLARELAKRQEAERALRASEERYRQLLDASPVGVFVQHQGKFTYANPKALEILGARSEGELLGRATLDFAHADSRDAIGKRIRQTVRSRSAATIETEGLRLDGSMFVARITPVPYGYEGPSSLLVVLEDATAARQAETQFERFFALSLDLLAIGDVGGRFRRVNPAFPRTLGWSEEELCAAPFIEYVHPECRANTLAALEQLSNNLPVRGHQTRYRCKDGSWRWLEWEAQPQSNGVFFASARDTTAQHEAASKLEQLNSELGRRVEERGAAFDALTVQKEELRAVLDHLIDCVVTIDARGIVQRANPALQAVLGYTPQEVTGRNVSMLLPEPHRSRHDGYLARYAETGKAGIIGSNREVEGRHKDGHLVPLELAVSEYVLRGERHFVGTLRDIRERKALMSELRKMWVAADEANRAKSAFLATMSHEIRTPMNGVIGLIDVLEQTGLDEQQADLARTMRDSGGALLAIIDNILDFSKIEAGKVELDREPVDLTDLVESVCHTLLPVATRHGVQLSLFIAPEIPQHVLTDDGRLRQILYNLVGNAIKFSGRQVDREGRVSIRAEIAEGDPLRLVMRIADNGIGMDADPEALNRLFAPFSQAEVSTTRRFGGTGLGLAICKRLVDLMEGCIAVESALGAGATFTVTLPFEVPAESTAAAQPSLSGIDCVLLENPALNADDLRAYLEDAGAAVHLVSDGVGVGEVAARAEGSVVLIQYVELKPVQGPRDLFEEFPGLHHLWITPGQRRRSRLTRNRVVTLDAGVLRRKALLRAVAVAAGLASPEIAYERENLPEEGRQAVLPTVAEARAQGRLILVAEDDEINQKVILKQLALLGYAAEVAGNGIEALRLWREGTFALVLTDLHMPEMDGYTLTQTIRGEEEGRSRTPILALTANALRGEATRAQEIGFDDYLTKPIKLQVLKAAIEAWLPTVATGSASHVAAVEGGGERDGPAVQVAVLENLVGNDPQVVGEFLGEYLAAALRQGKELRAAFTEGDMRQIGDIAHRLKSSSRSVGALALGDLCAELENGGRAEDRSVIAQRMTQFDESLAVVEAEISALLNRQKNCKGAET